MATPREGANETYPWEPTHPTTTASDNDSNVDANESKEALYQVTDHDVLSGRGVNIAQHAGNERFRALINARHDANYCHSYSTAEKRAVAEEIVAHIKALEPPGRFLRRSGRSNRSARGVEGPWEELTREEEIKKTCQALRDCNRQDRTGYAAAVPVPQDVHFSERIRMQSGMTNKQLAELAAAQSKLHADVDQQLLTTSGTTRRASESKRPRSNEHMEPTPMREGSIAAHAVTASAPWMSKRARLESTPSHASPTVTTSGGFHSPERHESEASGHNAPNPLLDLLHDQHQQFLLGYSPNADGSSEVLLDPGDLHFAEEAAALQAHFDEDEDGKPVALSLSDHERSETTLVADPLRFAREADAAAAAALAEHDLSLLSSGMDGEDFGPPSPLHHHHPDHGHLDHDSF